VARARSKGKKRAQAKRPAKSRPVKPAKAVKRAPVKPKSVKRAPVKRAPVKPKPVKPKPKPVKPKPVKRAPTQPRKRTKQKTTVAKLRKLAGRSWKSLGKKQQAALRSWRARKGAATRKANQYQELIERLNSTNRQIRARARQELRDGGTRGIARYLKDQEDWDDEDISDAIAFWFYAP